jgi:hypothetical protein
VRAAPNRAMVVDRRVSPWGGGGEDNHGGRKCNEDRGGSVECVDERREKKGSVYCSCGHGRRRARGGGREESTGVAVGAF